MSWFTLGNLGAEPVLSTYACSGNVRYGDLQKRTRNLRLAWQQEGMLPGSEYDEWQSSQKSLEDCVKEFERYKLQLQLKSEEEIAAIERAREIEEERKRAQATAEVAETLRKIQRDRALREEVEEAERIRLRLAGVAKARQLAEEAEEARRQGRRVRPFPAYYPLSVEPSSDWKPVLVVGGVLMAAAGLALLFGGRR